MHHLNASALATTLHPDTLTLPPLHPAPPALAPVQCVLRHEGRPLFDVYLSATASRRHPLQDGITMIPLCAGAVLFAVTDAATHAIGLRPEDATFVTIQALIDTVQALGPGRAWPVALLRRIHGLLRQWMEAAHGDAICGVVKSIVLIDPYGHVCCASIGDPRAMLYKPARLLRRERLITLGAPVVGSEQRLRSALGQSRGPLQLDVGTATMVRGDLLVMASDGGLPAGQLAELPRGLRGYVADRRAGRASLAQLGGVLDAQAQRHLSYDDDRSLILAERLA